MENDLMERLLADFNGVLQEFNELVRNNDYDGVRRVLNEVNTLLQERSGIVLDDRESPEYDHVLHELLDKMHGIVRREVEVQGVEGVYGQRYYTNEEVQRMIAEAEAEVRRLSDSMRELEGFNDEAYVNARTDRTNLIARIQELRGSLVDGQEFSTLTFTDPHLAELQEERARIVQERNANLREIERLRAEQTPIDPNDPNVISRLEEINSRMSEIAGQISGVEDQISAFRGRSLTEVINDLRTQIETRSELETRRTTLQEQLTAAGERVRETRGMDDAYAQARADYSALVAQINDLDRQLGENSGNIDDVEFLESFLPDVEQREEVLDPEDYTYMGRLSDEQIIRRLLSERLNLSDEEIDATINEYSLVQADEGAHDENGEDNPISLRQLVRTTTVKGDITIGEAIDALEAQLYDGPEVDHTQEIAEIDARIAELNEIISSSEARISEIQASQISDIILRGQKNEAREELESRRAALQEQLAAAGERVRETRGMDDAYAQARADYSALVAQINELDRQINESPENAVDVEFLESLLPDVEQREEVLDPEDYTYMGRLSDEQIIRRLLSERLNLSDEEIDTTINEYSLVQADEGAHDENGEDNPISLRQLVRTTTVKGDITVSEVLDNLNNEIAELESRRATLQEQLKAAAERLKETKGIDDAYAQARADYSAIVAQINELDSQLSKLNDKKSKIESEVGIESEQKRIEEAKNEIDSLNNRKNELEQNSERQENPEIRERINRLKEITGIAALEIELQQLKDELSSLESEKNSLTPKGKEDVDNSERINELEEKNKELNDRIAEIDSELEGILGVVPVKDSEELNIDEEAHRIGDHVFKAAKIRRELAEREVSRDEFLAFYKAGLDKTNEQIDELGASFKKIKDEIRVVVVDRKGDSGKRLDVQIADAEKAGDTELATQLYEQLRQNFIEAGREEQLKSLGIDHEITTQEDVDKLKEFFAYYKTSATRALKDIADSVMDLKENATIFNTEIARIQAEKETIEMVGDSIEEFESKSQARKDLRRKLLKASMTPEKDLTDEQRELLDKWQDASKRFLEKKTTAKYVYIDKDGKEIALDVETIDDNYPEYAQDVEFLGVPAYKENLEQISAYSQTHDPYVFGEEVGRAYENAEAQREGAGEEVLAQIMADKQKYVETFNGIPNPHRVKYENWKTAGSTLKGMKPVSRDLPLKTRAANAAENTLRFLGIRIPKFTRIDEHGNEVKDIKGGAATLAINGLVVGAVVGSAVTIGPALAVAGYAAKGIVTVGNRIAARVEYSRHKDEIDGNLPVLNQADSNSREVARKQYYREQGDNRLVSWFKAKSDKYFTRKRAKETEDAIADKLSTQYDQAEDQRTATIKENYEAGNANQKARLDRQRQVAMGANTYNDIVRDPDAVDIDEATAAIARNAALESYKQGSGREDVNKGSKEARRAQYVKQEQPIAKTSDLQEVEEEVDGPVSAITLEQIYTGRKQHVDRLNKVLTAITAGAIKFGYTAWKNGLTRTEVVQHEAETQTETIQHEAETVYHEPEYADVTETQFDTSKTLGELQQNYAGKTANEYYSVSGGLRGQRTEALVDKGITAGWFDNKTAWGTGISDSQGLSAPVLTDKLAQASLLDPSGAIRSDVTIQEFLNAMGCDNPDLTTLDGIYMSVGDRYWVALSDLMKGMTKEVVVGTKEVVPGFTETIEPWTEEITTVVREAFTEEVTKVDPSIIAQAIRDGLISGAAVGVADALHEAAQTTYVNGATPGRPEETTPQAKHSFDEIADELNEQAELERQENLSKKAEEAAVVENEENKEDPNRDNGGDER